MQRKVLGKWVWAFAGDELLGNCPEK